MYLDIGINEKGDYSVMLRRGRNLEFEATDFRHLVTFRFMTERMN